MAVVGAAGSVLVEQPLDRRRPELAARARALVEQQRRRASSRSSPRNQRASGTPKPGLPAAGDLGGQLVRERAPQRDLAARVRAIFSESGSETPSSSTSWSRSGERSSSECAIEAMSALSSRSPGRYVRDVEPLEPGDARRRSAAEQLPSDGSAPISRTHVGSQSSARSVGGKTSISRP